MVGMVAPCGTEGAGLATGLAAPRTARVARVAKMETFMFAVGVCLVGEVVNEGIEEELGS